MSEESTSQNKKNRSEQWDFIYKVLTTIGLIVGAIWGFMQYIETKNNEIDERKRNYEFALFKERKETLYPLCNAAADIVSSSSLKDAQTAIKSFERLYYGELNIIDDGQISDAVKTFADALLDYKNATLDTPPPFDLIAQSGNLGIICKKMLNLERVYGMSRNQDTTVKNKMINTQTN
jgi:hypothetical protein